MLKSGLIPWVERLMGVMAPEETAELERLLLDKLAPVAPRSDYIGSLGKLLSVDKQPVVAHASTPAGQLGLWQRLLLAVVGLTSGVLLVLLGVRLVGMLTAARREK